MAQLVVSAAGAAVGFFIGGPAGAQIGWAAGSLLGAALTPGPKTEGPRLADLSVSTSSYGTPIPYVQGHPRVAGQIIWASSKREIATTTEEGKGGGAEYTSYTYEVDLLILLTDNVIAGVSRVWSNGELVWSADTSATPSTVIASGATSHWQRMTVYTGSATQLPDPTYEAAVGTANAPAYRGRGSVMMQGLQLGGNGQIPNLTFEVVESGASADASTLIQSFTNVPLMSAVTAAAHKSEAWLSFSDSGVSATYHYHKSTDYGAFQSYRSIDLLWRASGFSPVWVQTNGTPRQVYGAFESSSYSDNFYIDMVDPNSGVITNLLTYIPGSSAESYRPQTRMCAYDKISGYYVIGGTELSQQTRPIITAGGGGSAYIKCSAIPGTVYALAIHDSIVYALHVDGDWKVSRYDLAGVFLNSISGAGSGFAPLGYTAWLRVDEGGIWVFDGSTGRLWRVGAAWVQLSLSASSYAYNSADEASGVFFCTEDFALFGNVLRTGFRDFYFRRLAVLSLGNRTLSSAVSDLCLRTGLAASQFDVTALAAITKPVRALAVSQVSSARSVLDILAAAYFFEAALSDKIYFRPRGAASVATLAYDELGYSADGASQADPLALRQANELELPAQVALTYSNVDADYQTDTQYSDRLLTGQDSTSTMQVPLAFTASEAKAIADAMLMDRAAGLISTSVSLGMQHTRLEPGDVVLLTGEDSSTYRMRLTRRAEADGVLRFDAVLDDASVFTQAGVTTGGTTSQTVVMALPNTTLELLDIAILRDADNLPGHYVAVKGGNSSWASAGVYSSLDNSSYTLSQTIGTQTVTGICSSTLGAWAAGNVFDEMNSVTVSVGDGQLASVTRDALLNSQTVNAALVGSELIQYRDAALLSTGVYLLSGLLRGRRGTEYAMTGHAANERFVKLGNAGMRFVPLQSSDLGRLRYYKGVTAGQRLSAVTAKTITPAGVGLECFAPVDARADRTTADTVLSWKRRTRLSTRLVGALPINAPLGETTESYEVEVYSSAAFTTLKRTLTSSTPSVTYTSAQQVADFGANQATLYLRIYQMSATVGRGYVLQATV